MSCNTRKLLVDMKQTIANSSFNNTKDDLVRGFRQEEFKVILKCIVLQFSSSMLCRCLGLPQVRNDYNKRCDFFCDCWHFGCRCAAFVGVMSISLIFITPPPSFNRILKKIAGAIPFTNYSNNSRCFGIVCFGKPKTSIPHICHLHMQNFWRIKFTPKFTQ